MDGILAIDPGITTGYAMLDHEGRLQYSGNLEAEDLDTCLLKQMSESEVFIQNYSVIIEFTPVPTPSQMNKNLAIIISKIDQMFPGATKVTPGVWKNFRLGARVSCPKTWEGVPLTQHQKDAFLLGMYYRIFVLSKKEALIASNPDSQNT